MAKRSYPNLLEWIRLATCLDPHPEALQAVHVSNGGRRMEATNRCSMHAAELSEPGLPDGLYYFSKEFGSMRQQEVCPTTYPDLQRFYFNPLHRNQFVLLEVAEQEFLAYIRSADVYEREMASSDNSLGVVRIAGRYFSARTLLPILAGLCFTQAKYKKFVRGPLYVQQNYSGPLMLRRQFEGQSRLAALSFLQTPVNWSGRVSGPTFDCTDFFEPVEQ